ncbi:MAG: hypothetical protein FJW81_09175, partial [Actinobacteria bacterium]|nr:hypothetical protein [Actinomycetota bacterium]
MDGHPGSGRIERERRLLRGRWLDVTDERNVLIAPVLSIIAFVLIAAGDASLWTRIVALLVQILLFEIVVTAHIRSPRWRRILSVGAPVAVIGTIS